MKIPGLYDQGADKKLFFFYSFEAPQVQQPGPLRLYRMPTALERQGDFSQTFDANGAPDLHQGSDSSRRLQRRRPAAPGAFPATSFRPNRLDATRSRC